ncbi:dehydrogenase/reductase SDR family member 4-like [Dermacentor silvarum]|uniref:dehydrogenase/reductase SDR family member 4-like n=1 Tax=Dermacentor silvarum TaxID=543639 RepID=UPI00210146A2|nr:dehydrogenase/reductase SDR family member 4-like [Dermacentor silvarum]
MQDAAFFWSMMFLVLAAASGLGHFFRTLGVGIAGENLTFRLRVAVLANILRQHMGWFDEDSHSSAKLASRLASDVPVVKTVSGAEFHFSFSWHLHLGQTPEAAWDKIFDINVKSAFLLTKEVVPHLEKRGGGSIVYVSSIAAYQSFPLLGAYSVSKTALLGLTRAVAEQVAPLNIRVNCIAPGIIKTKFSQALWKEQSVEDAILTQVPQKRLGTPEDCAGVVSFLVSDDARYVTGENVPVAGGFFCKL